jgi:4-hydroxy-3-methylbut-2-en-1-yl diphosphate reductase
VDGARTVGVTSGASAPEWLVDRVLAWLRERGATEIEEVRVIEEHMAFGLPRGVRDSDLAAAGA